MAAGSLLVIPVRELQPCASGPVTRLSRQDWPVHDDDSANDDDDDDDDADADAADDDDDDDDGDGADGGYNGETTRKYAFLAFAETIRLFLYGRLIAVAS